MSRTARNATSYRTAPPFGMGTLSAPAKLSRGIIRLFIKLRLLWIVLIAFLFLSGCVQYDVGINYASQTKGEIVQHIQVSDRLTTFSGSVVQDWLKSIERRTRQLGGKVRRTGTQALTITIPFNNGQDLEAKFNEFFQPTPSETRSASSAGVDLPEIESNLHIQESNFLLIQRNRLSYDLDLRSLGVLSANGNVLVSPGALLELEFALNTPWGARSGHTPNSLQPIRQQGHQLVWMLQAGQANHLEAVFWVPSPLGIGTVVILLVVTVGAALKAQLAPSLEPEAGQTALSESR